MHHSIHVQTSYRNNQNGKALQTRGTIAPERQLNGNKSKSIPCTLLENTAYGFAAHLACKHAAASEVLCQKINCANVAHTSKEI